MIWPADPHRTVTSPQVSQGTTAEETFPFTARQRWTIVLLEIL